MVIIYAAGEQERWDACYPKQLVYIHGEPLLYRTVRQLQERKKEVVVITHDELITEVATHLGVPAFEPEMRRWLVETILYTRHYWLDGAIFLLGDVMFTDATLDRIFAERKHVRIFGNKDELFAAKIHKKAVKRAHDALIRAHRYAHDNPQERLRGKLWHLYSALCNAGDLEPIRFESKVLCMVDDDTTDFDTVERYEKWRQAQG